MNNNKWKTADIDFLRGHTESLALPQTYFVDEVEVEGRRAVPLPRMYCVRKPA